MYAFRINNFCNNTFNVKLFFLSDLNDICQFESFNATCRPGEVIMMQSARYGRMRMNKCVLKDHGFVGCQTDILSYMDQLCSSRRTCNIKIPDPVLHKLRPCTDLISYLEVGYNCLQGEPHLTITLTFNQWLSQYLSTQPILVIFDPVILSFGVDLTMFGLVIGHH